MTVLVCLGREDGGLVRRDMGRVGALRKRVWDRSAAREPNIVVI